MSDVNQIENTIHLEKMSNVYQITNRKFQCQIWLSYILFSALIVFDIFVVLNASEPLVSRDCMEHANGTDNSSKVELVNQRLKEGVSTVFWSNNSSTLFWPTTTTCS